MLICVLQIDDLIEGSNFYIEFVEKKSLDTKEEGRHKKIEYNILAFKKWFSATNWVEYEGIL